MSNKVLLQRGIWLIFLLAVGLRFAALSHNSVFFYFDQARDAIVSRSIIENKDIKIQGPSVSGTNDSVYHGVLYYYVIAPLYSLSNGNPTVVAYFLALLGSLSVFIVYRLGVEVFESKAVGLIAAFLHAVSAVAIHQHTWLSNPQLNSLFLPLSYLLLWRIFLRPKPSSRLTEHLLFGLVVALSLQSALQSVVIFGSIAIATGYRVLSHRQLSAFSIPQILSMVVSFGIGISTMVLTELLLWKNGILSFTSLNLEDHSVSFITSLKLITERYWEIAQDTLSPTLLRWWSLPFIALILLYFIKIRHQQKLRQLFWLSLLFFAPLWLLLWHYRDPHHTFIGLEIAVYLALASSLWYLYQQQLLGKLVASSLVILFVVFQGQALITWKNHRVQHYGIQKGALLSEQLNLINHTFMIAANQPYSISTLSSPYAINTTWSYLYQWQSQTQQLQPPTYVGMSQIGLPGAGWLPESSNPERIHFTIIEPDTTLSDQQLAVFEQEQTIVAGPVVAEWQFGTLTLQQRGQQ